VQQEHGITAFYVTHDQAEAMAISDRVAVMEDGRVAQFGQPREIYRRPRSASVATFTGEATLAQVTVLGRSGEGCYRVALGSGDAEASGPPGIAAGARRTLMLRPESVSLADTGLPARVEACTFTGAALQCAVRLGEAALTLLAGADQAIAPGQTVQVQIDPAQAWLIPETAA
jgi:iron(III) transport system ATP-binding protein